MLLSFVTVSTYKLLQRMFLSLLGMPMRQPKNLCSLRIRSASFVSLDDQEFQTTTAAVVRN
jgi:hypothetical protein